MFGQKFQGKASYGKALEDSTCKGKACNGDIYIRANRDMAGKLRSGLVMVRHVRIMYKMIMHIM
jgi:hypothetical protein